jgi:hypothetical protein
VAFVVNALTFGVAVVFTVAIKDRRAFDVTRTGADEPAGLASEIADGAAAPRAHPAAIRLVGADILCSLVYGMQTVLLIMVARQAGLGLHGYGYLFAAIGAGALIGTSVAGRVARLPQHVALAGSPALVGLPTPAMPAARRDPARGVHRCRRALRRGHDGDRPADAGRRGVRPGLWARAAASIAGLAAGSLIAPALVSTFGATAALVACGAVVTSYCAVVWRSRSAGAAARTVAPPAAPAPMIGALTVPASAFGTPRGLWSP